MRLLRVPSVFLLLTLMTCGLALRGAAEEEMTTRVFKVPFNLMIGALAAPEPAPTAEPADPFAPGRPGGGGPEVTAVRSSRQILEGCGITFPPGARAVFDPLTWELTVHNTPAMLKLTEIVIDSANVHRAGPTLAFNLTVVEAPGGLVREANKAASRSADATPQLDELLAAAARPGSGVQVVAETLLDLSSGIRATVEAGRDRPQVTGFTKDKAATLPAPASPAEGKESAEAHTHTLQQPQEELSWVRQDGLRLELEGVLNADDRSVGATLALDLGPEEPAATDADGRASASAPLQALPSGDLRKARFVASVNYTSGTTRLIGITKPAGVGPDADNADILWAAFLTCHARRVVPQARALILPGTPAGKVPVGLRAVAFQVPEGLLESLIPELSAPAQAPHALREWLTTQGVRLAEGSSLAHRGGRLEIVATPEDLEIISALVEHAWAKAPRTLAFTLHTFEAPAVLLRQLQRQNRAEVDDAAMLAAVEAAATRGEAAPITSTFFEGKHDTRSIHECGTSSSHLAQFGLADATGRTQLAFRQRRGGSFLEIEPSVGAYGHTLAITYHHEMHSAPPAGGRLHLSLPNDTTQKVHDLPGADFHMLRTISSTTLANGRTRLLSLQRPIPGRSAGAGGPDVLLATFLQAHEVPQVGRPPPPPPVTPDEAAKARLIEKMNRIILPSVTFQEATLEQALEFLRVKSRELDTFTEAGDEKGVNFIVPADDIPNNASITLDLKDVPLSEALRYVTELAYKSYRVKAHDVLVVHSHYEAGPPLQTRSFRMPPDFLASGGEPAARAAPDGTDPFAVTSGREAQVGGFVSHKPGSPLLEAHGVTFPEGASIQFLPAINTVVVRNTQSNLRLLEALFSQWFRRPGAGATVAVTAEVLQGPGPLLRRIAAQAAPRNDHRAQLEELLTAVKAGTVQLLDTARIDTKSGTRATTEQGRDCPLLTTLTLDGKEGRATLQHDICRSGFYLELEPTLRADGSLVDLSLDAEYHTAPPVERSEHLIDAHGQRHDFRLTDTHLASITTGLTIPAGHTRLLHLWKPAGRPEFEKNDVLQVMFITCDVLRAGK